MPRRVTFVLKTRQQQYSVEWIWIPFHRIQYSSTARRKFGTYLQFFSQAKWLLRKWRYRNIQIDRQILKPPRIRILGGCGFSKAGCGGLYLERAARSSSMVDKLSQKDIRRARPCLRSKVQLRKIITFPVDYWDFSIILLVDASLDGNYEL